MIERWEFMAWKCSLIELFAEAGSGTAEEDFFGDWIRDMAAFHPPL